jgi:hypothetical protein
MMAMVLATMLVALAATSKPAAAYTATSEGRPGSMEAYKIQGSHYNSCQSMGYECWTPWVTGTGPVVYRSPATTGTQNIAVGYQLYRWNGSSWVLQNTRIYHRTLSAGYSWIQMPRPDFLPNSGGYFRVVTGVSWANSSGQNLGSKTLDYNQSGDYRCNTRFTSSCSSSDWVYLSSPGL